MTCEWDELGAITAGDHWTIRNVHERIEERGDAWRDYAKTRQSIAKAMKAIGVERVAARRLRRRERARSAAPRRRDPTPQIAPTLPVTGRTMPVM